MDSQPVSILIRRKIELLFPQDQWHFVSSLLESECGDRLPLIEKQGTKGVERIRAAVLKLSGGTLKDLERAVQVAKEDWRDVLVAAGFGNSLSAHLNWLNSDGMN